MVKQLSNEELEVGIRAHFNHVDKGTLRLLTEAYNEDPINSPKVYMGLKWIEDHEKHTP